MRGHIAGGTGVGVVTPTAAHVACLFNDQQIVLALFLEADGHAQSAKTGTDDDDLMCRVHGVNIPVVIMEVTIAGLGRGVYGIVGQKIVESGHA